MRTGGGLVTDEEREAAIQRQLRELEADPRFRKGESRPGEVTVTFLGPEAAERLRAAAAERRAETP